MVTVGRLMKCCKKRKKNHGKKYRSLIKVCLVLPKGVPWEDRRERLFNVPTNISDTVRNPCIDHEGYGYEYCK